MELALGTNLRFCTSVAKRLKLKFRHFWRPDPTFVEVTREKLVVGLFGLFGLVGLPIDPFHCAKMDLFLKKQLLKLSCTY